MTVRRHAPRALAVLLVHSTALIAPAAFAAEDSADVITVTAQKRAQDLQDVPMSIDVLKDGELDNIRAGGRDILFLAGRSPSLYAEASSGRTFPRFYIRGLGNTDFDLNANQPVSLVYDEVALENPILKGFPVFDLDRIEILKGPQGTLFGRNTPAGVIKFESARPTDEFEGYGRLAYGRFNTVDAEGAVSGPLADTLSARLSALYQRRDDFVDNQFAEDFPGAVAGDGADGFEEFQEFAGRLQFLWSPNADWSTLLNIHGRRLDGGSRLFRANIIEPGAGGLIGGFERDKTAQDATQRLDVYNFGVSAKTDWDVGFGVITSISSYDTVGVTARGDVDGGFGADFAPPSGPGFIPFAAESADNITAHHQTTSETRLAFRPAATVESTVGVFFFQENLELENLSFDTLAAGAENGRAVQDQETFAFAGFASSSWTPQPQLTLQGGVRLSVEDKDFTAERLVGPFGSGALGPVAVNLDDTNLSGDAAATWAFNDKVSAYVRYARGFRAPNVQGRIVFGDAITTAGAETINSVEAGLKTTFWNGRGRLNASGFYYRTKDHQLTAVGGAGNFNQLLNADAVVGSGFELDAMLNPTDALELTAGVSLNKTRIDSPGLEVGVCGAPCTVLDPLSAAGNALIDGNSLPQAPKWIASWTARYAVPVSNGELFVFTDWAYRSRINFFLYESVEFQDANELLGGVRVGWARKDGWELSAYGRNILNDVSIAGAIDFNNFSGYVNEPPLWGVEIAKRF